jgi:hypothetical protein
VKAIIEGKACFNEGLGVPDDTTEVEIQVIGSPNEDLDQGQILFVHDKVSLELNLRELQAALRMFEQRGYQR